jgi:hypothetical protein
MRITFPALSLTTPYHVCYQATLACLPLAVNLLAKCFFSQRSKISHVFGWAALPTLTYNPWALGSGCVLLAIYEIYLAYQGPSAPSKQAALKPAERKMTYDNPTFRIILLITAIENVINEEIYNAEELSKDQSLDEFETLSSRSFAQARLSGLLLKRELRGLGAPLLEPIREDLLQASQMAGNQPESLTVVDAFGAAVIKLRADQQEILHMLLQHLKRVSEKSAVNKMTSEKLASIFAPLLFNSPEAAHTTALVYLIDHTLLPSPATQPLLLSPATRPLRPSPTSQPLPRSQPKNPSRWETPNITKVARSLIDMIMKKNPGAAIYETAGSELIVQSYLQKLDKLLSIDSSPKCLTLQPLIDEISRTKSDDNIPASIFKRLFQRLEKRLLEPIRGKIRDAYIVKEPELKLEAFKTAINGLGPEEHELFRITLMHLGTIAKNCSLTQMDIQKLAESFVPLFFEIKPDNEHPLALGYAAACLVTPLAYLIDNADSLFE